MTKRRTETGWRIVLLVIGVILAAGVLLVLGESGLRRWFRLPLVYEQFCSGPEDQWAITGYRQPDFLWLGSNWVITIRGQVDNDSATCSATVETSRVSILIPPVNGIGRMRELRLFYSHDGTNLPAGMNSTKPPRRIVVMCDDRRYEWKLKQGSVGPEN